MTRPSPLRVVALAATVLSLATPAGAWPVIDVVASEVLSLDPPRVKTTFELSYAGDGPAYALFSVARIDGQVHGCEAPAGWNCSGFSKNPAGGVFLWQGGPVPPPPLAFAIVTTIAEPCVGFLFFNPFVNGVPTVSEGPELTVAGCLIVDAPVPARATSWGSVKSTYR
jgi:hypothetical protein